jgi:hypothetical protein
MAKCAPGLGGKCRKGRSCPPGTAWRKKKWRGRKQWVCAKRKKRALPMLTAVCPKRHGGRKVHQARGGGCYIKLANGQARFVKKRRKAA